MEYSRLLEQFKLLGDIMRQPSTSMREEMLLTKLNEIINEKIPAAFRKNAPPNYYELYEDFKALFDQLRNYVLHTGLIGKNVVALGGGFSSGKSSFLNAIDGENALPTSIDPSTAVPTFIVQGAKHDCYGYNIFGSHVPIKLNQIRSISSGFGEVADEEGNLLVASVTLGHVLKSIFLASPKQQYANLAFADTPGFSKPDADTSPSAVTDEHISRSQLNTSSYIMMFVQADAGTLRDEDIRFIHSLRRDIPKLFIVSKADSKNDRDLAQIVEHIKSVLTMSGIPFVDVLRFSSIHPEKYDTPKIRAILDGWNNVNQEPQFAVNFKKLFIACRAYFEKEIDEERRRLEQLNTSLTKLSKESEETISPLRQMVRDIQFNVQELKTALENLKILKNEFFTELKKLGDAVGIRLPEPSEVDLLDEIPDVLEVLRAYRKTKNIKSNPNTVRNITEAFKNVKREAEKLSGIAARRETVELIKINCRVDASKIYIHNNAHIADVFAKNIKNLEISERM